MVSRMWICVIGIERGGGRRRVIASSSSICPIYCSYVAWMRTSFRIRAVTGSVAKRQVPVTVFNELPAGPQESPKGVRDAL